MSRGRIVSAVTHTVTLGSSSYSARLTVTTSGAVAPSAAGSVGIFAATSSARLTSYGSISGGAGKSGRIGGTGGIGVDLTAGGTVTNLGLITGGAGGSGSQTGGTGGTGVYLNGGMLTNAGTISGGSPGGGSGVSGRAGYAVKFGTYAARLVIDPGAIFIGFVAGNGRNDTLVLGSLGTAGTLSSHTSNKAFSGFSSIIEAAGATWTLKGQNPLSGASLSVATGAQLVNDGSLNGVTLNGAAARITNYGSVQSIAASAQLNSNTTVINHGNVGYYYQNVNNNSYSIYGSYGGADKIANTGVIYGVQLEGGVITNTGLIRGEKLYYTSTYHGFRYTYGQSALYIRTGTVTNNGTIAGSGGAFSSGEGIRLAISTIGVTKLSVLYCYSVSSPGASPVEWIAIQPLNPAGLPYDASLALITKRQRPGATATWQNDAQLEVLGRTGTNVTDTGLLPLSTPRPSDGCLFPGPAAPAPSPTLPLPR